MSAVTDLPKRTEEPEVRRAQILGAAIACFREKGFHPTKIAEIAHRASISVGLIYQFFPGKDSLVEAIVLADIGRQIAWLEEQPTDLPLDFFAYLETFDRPEAGGVSMRMEILAELLRNQRLQAAVGPKQREAMQLLLAKIRSFLPGGGCSDLEDRLRLIGAIYFGAKIQFGELERESCKRFFTLVETVCREQLQHLLTPVVNDAREDG